MSVCRYRRWFIRRNSRNGGMAEWRNGGNGGEWQNSRMAEMATYVLFTVRYTPTTTTTHFHMI